MRCWIVKGRPDWDNTYPPGEVARWRTERPPKHWAAGDFVFFWHAQRNCRLIGFGHIVRVRAKNAAGVAFFDVRYDSRPLERPLTLEALRRVPALDGASFLRAGPGGTVFPLTDKQARTLARLVLGANGSSLRRAENALLQPIVDLPPSTLTEESFKGLTIVEPYVDWILDGKKDWELRSGRTHLRGPIALMKSGTGTIVGTADLVDCIGPLTVPALQKAARRHLNKAPSEYGRGDGGGYAWVLRNPRRLPKPVPYEHPAGAVIWVNLPVKTARRVLGTPGNP